MTARQAQLELDMPAVGPPRPERRPYGSSLQWQRVLNYLQRHGAITPAEAWQLLGVYRLADVIHKLRKRGHAIRTELVQVTSRHGQAVEFARYHLERKGVDRGRHD